MLKSVIRVGEKYYPEILLEECKNEMKKIQIENLVNDDLVLSSSGDKTGNESDNETEFDNDE